MKTLKVREEDLDTYLNEFFINSNPPFQEMLKG